MGLLTRIAIVIKSYVTAAGDRMERVAAEEELREAKARRKALEELKSLEADQAASTSPPSRRVPSPPPAVSESLAADFRLLGLAPGADLTAVEAAWRKLAERADPKRFPAGSEDEKKAARILESINAAYARIREALNPTEGRFGQLEL